MGVQISPPAPKDLFKYMNFIDLGQVRTYRNHGIDWSSVVGKILNFKYNDIDGYLTIINYNSITHKFQVQYLGKIFYINTDTLKKCMLGNLVNDLELNSPYVYKMLLIPHDYTIYSDKKVKFQCSNCGTIREAVIKDVVKNGLSCPNCSDSISYPEKYLRSLFNQLHIHYIYQYVINKYRFDFYIPKYNLLVECDGIQHYDIHSKWYRVGRDSAKDEFAYLHNYEIIRIDCRYSNTEYIKNNIILSDLLKHICADEKMIDFEQCALDACKSLVIMAAELYKANIDIDIIAKFLNLSRATIIRYLHKAHYAGIITFDINQLMIKRIRKSVCANKAKAHSIEVTNKKGFIKTFSNFQDMQIYFDNNLQIHNNRSGVSRCANGIRNTYLGYKFQYVS